MTSVVEVDLADIGHGFGLAGADTVRVHLGAERWPSALALNSLASATYDSVQRVEIIGSDRRAVADAVKTVRRLHDQYRRNAEDYEEPEDRPDVDPAAAPVLTGAYVAQLMGTKTRRAEAVTPVRCTTPGCTTSVSLPHPLPSSLKNIRCDRHRTAAG